MSDLLVDVDGDRTLAASIYDLLLVPAFPREELEDREAFVGGLDEGSATALVLLRGGEPAGVIVGYRYALGRVLLIGYLAVREDLRDAGVGSRLLTAARTRWSPEGDPIVVAEVEDPARRPASELQAPAAAAHGDPGRRLAFYRRHGATAIDRPYLQPRMHPASPRVAGLLLTVLSAPASALSSHRIPSQPVRQFLREYFMDSEGIAPGEEDEELRGLLERYADAAELALRPLPGSPSHRPEVGESRVGG